MTLSITKDILALRKTSNYFIMRMCMRLRDEDSYRVREYGRVRRRARPLLVEFVCRNMLPGLVKLGLVGYLVVQHDDGRHLRNDLEVAR